MSYIVGGDVDTYCTRCKMELAHVIVAVVDRLPKRVECKTCGSTHNFRSPSGARGPRKTTKIKVNSDSLSPLADYDLAISGRDLSSAKRYRVSETFEDGAVVDHKSFGIGVVTRVVDRSKIEVAFRNGAKTLIQGRGAR